MNKTSLIIASGIIGGFLGAKLGVPCIEIIPNISATILLLFSLATSLAPFIVITAILIFKMQGYASYTQGLIFSFAYYLPFQYKAIWINYKQPNIEISETLTSRLLITVAGSLLLSSLYYAAIKYQTRKRKGIA
jgi:hypothetical protein